MKVKYKRKVKRRQNSNRHGVELEVTLVRLIHYVFVVRCYNVKNDKEASEVTEGKSSRMHRER